MLKHLLQLHLALSTLLPAAEFKAEKGVFVVDGKPIQTRSGEITAVAFPAPGGGAESSWRGRWA